MSSNAPYTPPPPIESRPPEPIEPVDYESVPSTGVRKVLGAYEERDIGRVRWGAVIAGLFLAIGTHILLGLLGVAVGLTAIDPRSASPLEGLGLGAGIWMGAVSLVALFIGGYAAAKLSGAIRRTDGLLSGLLTWATFMVLTLWLIGASAGAAIRGASNVPEVGARARGTAAEIQQAPERAGRMVLGKTDDAARAAWGTFGGACLALGAALLGGAVGSVGVPRHGRGDRMRHASGDALRSRERDESPEETRERQLRDDRERELRESRDRDETWRNARERDREAMERDVIRHR